MDDNLLARKHVTQVRVLKRAGEVLIALVTAAAALMTFASVRVYGLSLFASAGAASLVVGLAARPLLTNLIAGVQIAVTQPIRLEDAVIVEGEWGWVEEITSTYVVVGLWDWRRMVLPLCTSGRSRSRTGRGRRPRMVAFAISQPEGVNVNEILFRPTRATAGMAIGQLEFMNSG